MADLYAAWCFSSLIANQTLNGELDAMSPPWKAIAEKLATIEPAFRAVTIDAMLGITPGGEEMLRSATRDVDPHGPAPTVQPVAFATLADIARLMAEQQWLWPGWIGLGVLNAVASDPGIGKTRFGMDISRRLWKKLVFPDGAVNPYPAGTRTLWIQGDRNFGEMLKCSRDFGLPDDAVVLGSAPNDPLGSLDLDDPDTISAIGERIIAAKTPLVIIDTVGMTTSHNLSKPNEAREFFAPLMDLASKTGVALEGLTHLSMNKEALGRRIVEKARIVVKMTQPNPEGQINRRRLWVDKSAIVKPQALGITMGDSGNEYDGNPPSEPEPARPGPAPVRLAECKQWLKDQLTPNPAAVQSVRTESDKAGFSVNILYKAKHELKVDEYVVGRGKWWKLPVVADVGDQQSHI